MTLTRRQLAIRAIARKARLKRGEAFELLGVTNEAYSIRKGESDSAEAALQKSLGYAHALSVKGEELNLSLYHLASHYVSASAANALRMKAELERSEQDKQRATDAMLEASIRVRRLEQLAEDESIKVSKIEQARSQATLDESVVVRHRLT